MEDLCSLDATYYTTPIFIASGIQAWHLHISPSKNPVSGAKISIPNGVWISFIIFFYSDKRIVKGNPFHRLDIETIHYLCNLLIKSLNLRV